MLGVVVVGARGVSGDGGGVYLNLKEQKPEETHEKMFVAPR
jgi:hypothetical protein